MVNEAIDRFPRPALHLAQYNIAKLRHPIGHPATEGFVELIDDTNAHAEASPGFVWRHGIDSRDTDDAPYDDRLITVNASVWESIAHLREFAYRGFHREVFRRRQEWMVDAAAVMWWIPAGTIPTLQACMARLAFHDLHGSTPYAFETGQQQPVLAIAEEGPTGLQMWLDDQAIGRAAWRIDATDAHLTSFNVDDSRPELHDALHDAVEVALRDRAISALHRTDGSVRRVTPIRTR